MMRNRSLRTIIFTYLMAIVTVYAVVSIIINVTLFASMLKKETMTRITVEADYGMKILESNLDAVGNVYANIFFHLYEMDLTDRELGDRGNLEEFIRSTVSGVDFLEAVYVVDLSDGQVYSNDSGIGSHNAAEILEEIGNREGLMTIHKGEDLIYAGKMSVWPVDMLILMDINENIFTTNVFGTVSHGTVKIVMNGDEMLIASEPLDFDTVKAEDGEWLIGGERYLAFEASSEGGFYSFLVLEKRQHILQPVYTATGLNVLLLLLTFVLEIIFGFGIAETLSGPVIQLKDRLHAYRLRPEKDGAELLDVKDELKAVEYQELYESFGDMMDRINRQIDDIQKVNMLKENEQIKNIRAAINPHFQYNTLNAIIWMLEDGRVEEATEVVSALGKYYRNALDIEKDYKTLEDELEMLQEYMVLLNMTVEDSVGFEVYLKPDLKQCQVPTLLLLSIVENAMVHGFKGVKGDKAITVRIQSQGDDLVISIKDNGNGIQNEALKRLRERIYSESSGGGFGLWNVNRRVKLLYGADYGVELESIQGSYTAVTVRIRKKVEKVYV